MKNCPCLIAAVMRGGGVKVAKIQTVRGGDKMFIVENLWKIILGIVYICWTIYAFWDIYKWCDGKRIHGDWYNGENGAGFFIWGVVHVLVVFFVSLSFYIQHYER